jgi:hypothetical protein
VQLKGGLGNQLFQYAAGRRLSLTLGVPLKLDISFYNRHSQRTYELDRFCIEADIATLWEAARWRGPRLLTRITQRLGLLPRLVLEKGFEFDPAILHLHDRRYLDGYWQSYRYFADVAPQIRRELAVRIPPSDADRMLLDRMRECESVCVHVRRGDYLTAPPNLHWIMGPHYYTRAVQEFNPNLRWYVVSDDIAWCKQQEFTEFPMIEIADEPDELRSLALMSLCHGGAVIGNSTYSWWGAMLGAEPAGATVVYPSKWFSHEKPELFPSRWIRL